MNRLIELLTIERNKYVDKNSVRYMKITELIARIRDKEFFSLSELIVCFPIDTPSIVVEEIVKTYYSIFTSKI
jgi:hypothetical protein